MVEFWNGDTVGCFLLQWVPELLCLSCYFIAEMSQSKTASSDCLSQRTESCCKDSNIKTSDPFLRLPLKGISNKRIGLSKLWEKEKDSKGIHIRFFMWTPVQRTNTHKGICKQQTLYFGQCQILKREQKNGVKMQGVILITCQEVEPIKQNSAGVLSQHLILCYSISVVNLLCRGRGDQSPFLSAHTYWNLFLHIGGQTLFIWCPLRYIYSVSINLNLQHCDVKHYATAALSQQWGLRRTGILHIGCDFAHDWLHVCFLTANILQDWRQEWCPPLI